MRMRLQSPSEGFLIQATVTMICRAFLKNSYLFIILKILFHWIWGKAWEPVFVCLFFISEVNVMYSHG